MGLCNISSLAESCLAVKEGGLLKIAVSSFYLFALVQVQVSLQNASSTVSSTTCFCI